MNKANSLLFKLLIPLAFILSSASIVLPSVSLNIPEKNIDNISQTISDYNETKNHSPEQAAYEENGRINVYMAVEDNSLSLIEIVDLNSYVSNVDVDKIEIDTDEDEIFISVVNFVNEKYTLFFVLVSIIIVFAIIGTALSVLRAAKLSSVLNLAAAVMYLAASLALAFVQKELVNYTLNDNNCFTAEMSVSTLVLLIGAAAAVIITMCKAIIAFTAKPLEVREYNPAGTQNNSTIRYTPAPVELEQKNKTAFLFGISGEYMGAKIELKPYVPVKIGRDPGEAQLIINSEKVSRKHCILTFDAALNKLIVVDCSVNGTYAQDGQRLLKNHQNLLPPDSIIVIENNSFQFRLK